ncbi:MAG: hypothetical protein IPO21_02245 [Bacteroidales bacterium]|nr:hypothetical protein [Bacteroidales bacterium]
MENRGKDFFAAGPMVSTMLGYSFDSSKNNKRIIGLRPFYIPLFSADKSMPSGTVLGGVLEMQFYF